MPNELESWLVGDWATTLKMPEGIVVTGTVSFTITTDPKVYEKIGGPTGICTLLGHIHLSGINMTVMGHEAGIGSPHICQGELWDDKTPNLTHTFTLRVGDDQRPDESPDAFFGDYYHKVTKGTYLPWVGIRK